jgi:hypothetical protein
VEDVSGGDGKQVEVMSDLITGANGLVGSIPPGLFWAQKKHSGHKKKIRRVEDSSGKGSFTRTMKISNPRTLLPQLSEKYAVI